MLEELKKANKDLLVLVEQLDTILLWIKELSEAHAFASTERGSTIIGQYSALRISSLGDRESADDKF